MKDNKRTYKKPMIYIEEFSVSQSIASNCQETSPNFYKSSGCAVADTGKFDEPVMYFTLGIGGKCTHEYNWDDNKGCYHIPSNLSSYFGS